MNIFRLFTLMVVFHAALLPAAVHSAVSEDPSLVIRKATEDFIDTMTNHQKKHGDKAADKIAQPLLEILEPVVDFKAIAKGIMGRHAQQASEQQLMRFTQVFKEWLIRYYLDSLINFEVKDVTVFEQPADFNPESGRATVRMQATTGNAENYSIKYSMRADSAGHWKVRNFIFEGVNIGLTFLHQFDGAMERYDGKIDEVIANWSGEMAQNDKTMKP
jgi:phospholipid transport system substrate-binding protein